MLVNQVYSKEFCRKLSTQNGCYVCHLVLFWLYASEHIICWKRYPHYKQSTIRNFTAVQKLRMCFTHYLPCMGYAKLCHRRRSLYCYFLYQLNKTRNYISVPSYIIIHPNLRINIEYMREQVVVGTYVVRLRNARVMLKLRFERIYKRQQKGSTLRFNGDLWSLDSVDR